MTAGGLTILTTARDLLATKKWTWHPSGVWVKKSYSNARSFWFSEAYEMTGIGDLAEAVQLVARNPRSMIIRGALTQAARARIEANPKTTVMRRKHPRGRVEPDFIEVERQWLMIDIDNFRMRARDDLADDPESAIQYAIGEILPLCFQDVRCFWQLSSSAGFDRGVLKAHLFYWLTAPLMDAVLKKPLKQHAPRITDLSVYQGVQPHFVATPVIEGRPDPIPRRFGWIEGAEDAVRLPPLKVEEPSPRAAGGTHRDGGFDPGGDPLARLGDGGGLGGFHEPLRSACLTYARRINRGNDRDDAGFINTLKSAIDTAPRHADRDVTCYDDEYLKRSIAGAFDWLRHQNDPVLVQPHPAAAIGRSRPPPDATTARDELGGHIKAVLARATTWHRAKAAHDAASG